ncbi:hypothetical protein C1646_675177 [Rhizophagus diaphanus]|nr:hypothetical protein C1646_675177 [Rhizophagus diaphanus] [Rhizophagus sp. MUCL 43196]
MNFSILTWKTENEIWNARRLDDRVRNDLVPKVLGHLDNETQTNWYTLNSFQYWILVRFQIFQGSETSKWFRAPIFRISKYGLRDASLGFEMVLDVWIMEIITNWLRVSK